MINIIDLYKQHGHAEYIGEPVSQLEHAYQAGHLALSAGATPDVVIAAFLHDIGHLCADAGVAQMDGLGTMHHEQVGADFLRAHGLPERVAKLTESHVQAKRYLTFTNPDYYNGLSDASRGTLRWQGGPMNEAEARDFEQDPDFEVILQLRQWDEQAKIEGQPVSDLTVFESILHEMNSL
jgi:2-amino-1-hydroxyethylphosphonate dioxygenase (glycine-forming)